MVIRVLSKAEALDLRQKIASQNFSKAEEILTKYNPYLSEEEKKKVKLDIVKIFNLISNFNLKEEEILPDVCQLVLNKQHQFINEYYKDLSQKSRKYKNEIDELILEGVEKRTQNQTKYPDIFTNSDTVYFQIDEIIPLSKKIIDAQNFINQFQDEENQISLKESAISKSNRAKQEEGVGYRLVYKGEEYKVNKFINSKIKVLENLKLAFSSSSEEKKAEFVSCIQNLQYAEYHKQKKDFSGELYKKFDDDFVFNVVKNFKLEKFENQLEELTANMNEFVVSMKRLADKNDAIRYDDVSDDNIIDMIEFSISPYKIATASTYKDWDSCMALNKNEHFKLIDSIAEGEIVVYMINSKKPSKKISRVLLKPYENKNTGNTFYKLAPFYGKQVSGLNKLLKSIVDDNFHTKKKGVYKINPNVYEDKLPSSISVYDNILELMEANNVEYSSDNNNIFIDQDLDLTKFGKLEFNEDFPNLYVNGKVILTEENVNHLSFSKLPDNRDGIENLSYLGNLDIYSTAEVLCKVYGNNWVNSNIEDKDINRDVNLRNLNIKSLPHDFVDYYLVGKMDLRSNEINHLDLDDLPDNRDGILLSNIGDVSDKTSMEFFSKVLGDKWVEENITSKDGVIKINSDVKLVGMGITKLPKDFSDIKIEGQLNLQANNIEELKLSDLPETTKGIKSIKGLGDVSDFSTLDLLSKINGSEWVNDNLDIENNVVNSDLSLLSLGIKKLPKDFSEYYVKGAIDLRLNNLGKTDLASLPLADGGVNEVKALGDLSEENIKDVLLRTKGKNWIDSFYKEIDNGKVIIDTDLKLDNYGITDLPKDFNNISFINGEYSLWGNGDLLYKMGLADITENAKGVKGLLHLGDVSHYDTKIVMKKTSGVDWYKVNVVEGKNGEKSMVEYKLKLTQLGISKLPNDINQYKFAKGLLLWGNKIEEVEFEQLPCSSETEFDKDVKIMVSEKDNNLENLKTKGIGNMLGNSRLIVSNNDNQNSNELIDFYRMKETLNQR